MNAKDLFLKFALIIVLFSIFTIIIFN